MHVLIQFIFLYKLVLHNLLIMHFFVRKKSVYVLQFSFHNIEDEF